MEVRRRLPEVVEKDLHATDTRQSAVSNIQRLHGTVASSPI